MLVLEQLPSCAKPPDVTSLLQPNEGRVERALVDREGRIGHLLEARGQCVRVQRSHGAEGLQHDQVERSLEKLHGVLGHATAPCHALHSRMSSEVHLIPQWMVGKQIAFSESYRDVPGV